MCIGIWYGGRGDKVSSHGPLGSRSEEGEVTLMPLRFEKASVFDTMYITLHSFQID
jgi:hypothetical protein